MVYLLFNYKSSMSLLNKTDDPERCIMFILQLHEFHGISQFEQSILLQIHQSCTQYLGVLEFPRILHTNLCVFLSLTFGKNAFDTLVKNVNCSTQQETVTVFLRNNQRQMDKSHSTWIVCWKSNDLCVINQLCYINSHRLD